jgi:hypothetical protein
MDDFNDKLCCCHTDYAAGFAQFQDKDSSWRPENDVLIERVRNSCMDFGPEYFVMTTPHQRSMWVLSLAELEKKFLEKIEIGVPENTLDSSSYFEAEIDGGSLFAHIL